MEIWILVCGWVDGDIVVIYLVILPTEELAVEQFIVERD